MYRNRDVIGHNAFSIVQTGAQQTNEQTLAQRTANTQQTVSVVPIHHHQPKANTLYMNTCCNISNIAIIRPIFVFEIKTFQLVHTTHSRTHTHAQCICCVCAEDASADRSTYSHNLRDYHAIKRANCYSSLVSIPQRIHCMHNYLLLLLLLLLVLAVFGSPKSRLI